MLYIKKKSSFFYKGFLYIIQLSKYIEFQNI